MRVGVFDSGMGGLTVLQSMVNSSAQYDYLYLGDNARTPYGNRSFEMILKFTWEAVEFLFNQDCLIVIIACNTASAKALRTIQQRYLTDYPDRRVLGVIRPSVENMEQFTSTKTLAIWATQGTVLSNSYVLELNKLSPGIRVIQQACPMLVPLIENGELDNEGLDFFIRKYWAQTAANSDSIDALLLACTHYQIIVKQIENIVPEKIKVISQGTFIGPSWSSYLHRHPELENRLSKNAARTFLTTDRPENFNFLAKTFLGYPVEAGKCEY